jgi:peptidoglycan/LPS O-acetylase OafA/YrhL
MLAGMSRNAPDRLVHIDAMRAIAALLVLWIHVTEDIPDAGRGWFGQLALDLNAGGIGVMLFFMISGFVIPASLRPGRPRGEELRRFVIGRFFRLYPLFWASIVVALLFAYWPLGREVDGLAILANTTMAPQLFGQPMIQTLYWTLLTELVFYVLCAGLFAAGLLDRAGVLAGVGLALSVLFICGYVNGVRTDANPLHFVYYREMPMHLALMFASALLRKWHDGELAPGTARSLLLFQFGLWVIVLAWMSAAIDSDGQLGWRYLDIETTRAIGVVLFLVLCFWLKPTWTPLVWLGRVSYSFYLLHRPLMAALLWLAGVVPAMAWLRADLFISLGAVLLIAGAASLLAYRFIEVPCINLGRRLSRAAAGKPGATNGKFMLNES